MHVYIWCKMNNDIKKNLLLVSMFYYSGILEVMDIKLKLLQNSHDSEHLSLLVHVGLEVEFDTSLHDRTILALGPATCLFCLSTVITQPSSARVPSSSTFKQTWTRHSRDVRKILTSTYVSTTTEQLLMKTFESS